MQLLGFRHIDAKVVDVDDDTAEAMSLEENLFRHELPDPDAAVARLVELHEAQMPTKRGGDRRSAAFVSNSHGGQLIQSAAGRVAAATNRSERQVRRSAKIASNASAAVKAALAERRINQSDAERLAGLPPSEQDAALSAAIERRASASGPLQIVLRAVESAQKALRRRAIRVEPADLERLQSAVAALLGALAAAASGEAA